MRAHIASPGAVSRLPHKGVLWPALVLHVLVVSDTYGHHDRWWTCNSQCARCMRRVMPVKELIEEFYSGLFSANPPDAWAGSPGGGLGNFAAGGAPFNDSVSGSVPIISGSSTGASRDSSTSTNLGCCETILEYNHPPTINYKGKIYDVVHLEDKFQFIPIGRCKPGSTCTLGTCVTVPRAHFYLVYNTTSLWGISFVPISVPSHCECKNIVF